MEKIYEETCQKVKNGSRFYVNFQTRSLKVDGKYVIENGKYEGTLGIPKKNTDEVLKDIEMDYAIYKHSVPSERSESRRHNYFKALAEKDLNKEDMLYGIRREEARCELELYVLCSILNDSFNWDEIDSEQKKWFWQSQKDKDLIILKSWIVG